MDFLKYTKLIKLEFQIQAKEQIKLPYYKGSTFRGAFGNTFKCIVCPTKQESCTNCIISTKCIYRLVFESPNPHRNNPDFKALQSEYLPHSFIIEPPETLKTHFNEGDTFSFNLILIGKTIDYLPYFIYTFVRIGEGSGIGKDRKEGYGRFTLTTVKDTLSNEIIYEDTRKFLSNKYSIIDYETVVNSKQQIPNNNSELSTFNSQLTLHFLTHTRMQHNGKFLVKNRDNPLTFDLLIKDLYRRLYVLTYFYCYDLDGFLPYNEPETDSNIIISDYKLRWEDWERYSSRQDTKMKLGGFVGTITFKGDIGNWINLLKFGEYVHIGKATTFGNGKFVIK